MRIKTIARLAGCAALMTAPLILATQASAQAPAPQLAPALVPAHTVDLMTADGMDEANATAAARELEAEFDDGPPAPSDTA